MRTLIRNLPEAYKAPFKTALELADPLYIRGYRYRHSESRPIPPMGLRSATASRWIHLFVESGRLGAAGIKHVLRDRFAKSLADFSSVLDFGCGCGRTIMHFGDELNKLSGCDVNPKCIDWMQRGYPQHSFLVNEFEPPLPYRSGEFDLVYSISIFSHLALHSQLLWLPELHRVLAQDGVCLISVQGETWLRLRQRHQMAERLARQEALFIPYERTKMSRANLAGIHGDYGMTYLSRSHITRRWSKFFRVDAIYRGLANGQDIVVLLRR